MGRSYLLVGTSAVDSVYNPLERILVMLKIDQCSDYSHDTGGINVICYVWQDTHTRTH